MGPTGPRWVPCWPRELCYLGLLIRNVWTVYFTLICLIVIHLSFYPIKKCCKRLVSMVKLIVFIFWSNVNTISHTAFGIRLVLHKLLVTLTKCCASRYGSWEYLGFEYITHWTGNANRKYVRKRFPVFHIRHACTRGNTYEWQSYRQFFDTWYLNWTLNLEFFTPLAAIVWLVR